MFIPIGEQSITMKEVSADKAYSSHKNLELIAAHQAVPYIPFKSNTNGVGWRKGDKVGKGSDPWQNMWHFYNYNSDQFMQHLEFTR